MILREIKLFLDDEKFFVTSRFTKKERGFMSTW
jgi:hypothetical protein